MLKRTCAGVVPTNSAPCSGSRLPAGIAARVLEGRGVELKPARAAVEAVTGASGQGLVQQIVELPLSGKADAVLAAARREAVKMGEAEAGGPAPGCRRSNLVKLDRNPPGRATGQQPRAHRTLSVSFGASGAQFLPAGAPLPPLAGVPDAIGTQHLLMALLAEEQGPTKRVLGRLGIDDEAGILAEARWACCAPCFVCSPTFRCCDWGWVVGCRLASMDCPCTRAKAATRLGGVGPLAQRRKRRGAMLRPLCADSRRRGGRRLGPAPIWWPRCRSALPCLGASTRASWVLLPGLFAPPLLLVPCPILHP